MNAAQICRQHLHDVQQEASKRLQLSHAFRLHGKPAEAWSFKCDAEVLLEYADKVESPLLEYNKQAPAANDNNCSTDPSNTRRTMYHAR